MNRPVQIVMIDDEEWFLELITEAIHDWFPKLDLMAFQNRDFAWQHLQRHEPDLLITDLKNNSTPIRERDIGFDGWRMLGLLAERGVTYPVLVLSGAVSNDGYAHVARDVAWPDLNVSFLAKPFTLDQLHAALFQCIGAKMRSQS